MQLSTLLSFSFVETIREFGNLALTLLLALFTAILIGLRSYARAGMLWLAGLVLALVIGAITKILYFSGHAPWHGDDFRGLSGHSLRATYIYPSFALALFNRQPRGISLGAAGFAWLLAIAVMFASVQSGAHSAFEALSGGLVGAALSYLVRRGVALRDVTPVRQLAFLCVTSGFLTIAGRLSFDVEPYLVQFAAQLTQ